MEISFKLNKNPLMNQKNIKYKGNNKEMKIECGGECKGIQWGMMIKNKGGHKRKLMVKSWG